MTDYIDASGPLASRYLYNSEDVGFTYLAVDNDQVYVLISVGVWEARNFFRTAFIEVGPPGEIGPEGPAGEDGNVFQINAAGAYNNRYLYDGADIGFSYLAVDTDTIYVMSTGRVWEEKIIFRTDFIEQGPQGEIGPTGPTGPAGAKGDTGDAGSGINWKGAWSSAVEYVANDAVEYGGSSYVATGTNTNSVPTSLTNWNLWVLKGAQGIQGIQGIPGTNALPPTTSWSSVPNNVRYPSELLVYSSLGLKANSFHAHSNVSWSADGFMSVVDKSKLDGIASGAQVNVGTTISQGTLTGTTIPLLSSTGSGTTLPSATTSLAGLMSASDKTKLDGVAVGANNYVHPTGNGNLHVPASGIVDEGKTLQVNSSGIAAWNLITPPEFSAAITMYDISRTTGSIPTDYKIMLGLSSATNTSEKEFPLYSSYTTWNYRQTGTITKETHFIKAPSFLSAVWIPENKGNPGPSFGSNHWGIEHIVHNNGSSQDCAAVAHIYTAIGQSDTDGCETTGFYGNYYINGSGTYLQDVIETTLDVVYCGASTATRGFRGWLHLVNIYNTMQTNAGLFDFLTVYNGMNTVEGNLVSNPIKSPTSGDYCAGNVLTAGGNWKRIFGTNRDLAADSSYLKLTIHECGIDLCSGTIFNSKVPAIKIPATSFIDLYGEVPGTTYLRSVNTTVDNATKNKFYVKINSSTALCMFGDATLIRLADGSTYDPTKPTVLPTTRLYYLAAYGDGPIMAYRVATANESLYDDDAATNPATPPSSSTVSTPPFTVAEQSMGIGLAPLTTYSLRTSQKIYAEGEIISKNISGNAFRAITGNFGVFLRNDGSNFYILSTASGNQFGDWNTLRPLTIQISTGNITFGHAVTINGLMTIASTANINVMYANAITIAGISTFNGNIAANGFATFYSNTYYSGTYASLYSAKDMVFANGYGMKVFDSGGNLLDVIKVTPSNNIHIGINTYKSVYLGYNGGYRDGCPVVVRAKNENLRVSYVESGGVKWLVGITDLG